MRPVQRIELSEKHTRQRLIAVIACLIVASGAFIYALNGLMSNDSGWTSIEASSSAETNCGDDFVFQYYVGAAGVDATAEKKALTLLYTDALVKAYEVFHNDEAFEGVNNIYEINQHPNEELTVDPVLYGAFETVAEYGRREVYLAPVYLEYKNLFFCNDDSETFHYDAEQNADVRTYFGEIAAYANDPSMVNVELLGDNRLKLHVSEEYLAYAKENGIEKFVDFAWMQNAFITDYLSDVMVEKGYTLGSISSCDGYTRNLDEGLTSEEGVLRQYSYNIYDRNGMTVYPAGLMNYTGPISMVSFHNYIMTEKEADHYYEFQDGETRTSYISMEDGRNRSSVNNLVAYSKRESCAQILLQLIPVYIADELDTDAVKILATEQIYCIYGKNRTLYYTEKTLDLTDLFDKDGVSYKAQYLE